MNLSTASTVYGTFSTMTRRLGRVLLVAVTVAAAAATASGQTGVRVGEWNFGCRDGKLVAVQVLLRIPGEVLVPVPPDICSQAWLDRNALGLSPAATIKPLAPITPTPPSQEPAAAPQKKPI